MIQSRLLFFGFIGYFLSFNLEIAQANQSQPCFDYNKVTNQTRIQQLESRQKDTCYLLIFKAQAPQDLVYRDFLISSKGSMLVFLSLGVGPEEYKNGSKEFFFFPRDVKNQNFEISEDQKLLKVNGRFDFNFIFDLETNQLLSMENAIVNVSSKISPDNEAGIEMKPTKGLIYELPFTLGGAPSGQLNLFGVFKDAFGNECRIKNSTLFRVYNDDETEVKYNDAELKIVLDRICPQLKY